MRPQEAIPILSQMASPRRSAKVEDLNEHRDRDLISRMASGEEAAFVELYRRYSSASYGLAYRVIGDGALAEEVLQEVYTSVWRRAGMYDQARGTVRSWLLAQVHHKAVDVVRRESAERRRSSQPMDIAVEDPMADVVEDAWLATRRVEVREALAALPEDQRKVIELAYSNGMTQTQVSEHMSIPLGTVKSRTLGAMRRLRSLLGGTFEGGEAQPEERGR